MDEKAQKHYEYAEKKMLEIVDQATDLRNKQILSQREVAKMLGMTSHGNITMIEQHKTIPRLDNFLRLLSVYGYTLQVVPKEHR